MIFRKPADIRSSEITPRSVYLRRRDVLALMGMTAASAFTGLSKSLFAASTAHGTPLQITSKMVTTSEALTPFDAVTSFNNFYEFGEDKDDPARNSAPFKPSPWFVTIDGECAKPGTYSLEDVLNPHPFQERIYRMRCVEGWSMVIPWVGFPLADLLKRFQPTGNAQFVEFTSVLRPAEMSGQRQRYPAILPWPYKEGLRMDEAMHALTILAVGVYGETLPNQNGAPLRLVVPWKYGFKGIKSIVKISFVRKQPKTTWEDNWPDAYGFYSNVNPAVGHPTHTQAYERRIGEFFRRETLMFNGYGDQVASMYNGLDLKRFY